MSVTSLLYVENRHELSISILNCKVAVLPIGYSIQHNLISSTSQSSFTEDLYIRVEDYCHRTYKKDREKRDEQKKQYTYKCNIERCLRNHCCRGKAISITYSDCVSVALGIKHAVRMSRIILSSVACLTLPYFFSSPKRYDFREKAIEHKIRVLFFSTTFVRKISHSTKNRARYYHKCT